jgi:uncharacterized protein (DUF1684 family)
MKINSYFIMLLFLICGSCHRNSVPPPDKEAYSVEIETWRANRLERLKSREGWLNLAGLYWMKEGMNTFGSDTSNTIVFPSKAPAFIGTIERSGDSVFLRSVSEPVLIDGLPAVDKKLKDDASGKPDVMMLNSMAWHIIKREKQYGIRLRDYTSPMIDSLTSIPYFEINEDLRIIAEFRPYGQPEKQLVPTIIGVDEETLIPGELEFRIRGNKLILYPSQAEDGFFIVFGDQTNGNETYAAGRFLYTAAPDANNRVIIDFNKSYNPPCAFTPYATCPLPLRRNILPVRIEAGEKAVHLSYSALIKDKM